MMGRRVRTLSRSILALCLAGLAAFASAAPALPFAVLVRGNARDAGLPGFGANALPCLSGAYRVGQEGWTADARLTTEVLAFGKDWTERRLGSYRVREKPAASDEAELPAGAAYRLLAVDRPYPQGGRGAEPELWSVVVAVPAGADGKEADAFLRALLDRIGYFLASAPSPSDVSLPAVVER